MLRQAVLYILHRRSLDRLLVGGFDRLQGRVLLVGVVRDQRGVIRARVVVGGKGGGLVQLVYWVGKGTGVGRGGADVAVGGAVGGGEHS